MHTSRTVLCLLAAIALPLTAAPVAAGMPVGVQAPAITEVYPLNGALDVSFVRGAGADPEAKVVLTAQPGGQTVTVARVNDPGVDAAHGVITGLDNSTAYSVTAVETSYGVTSPSSEPSEFVKPRPPTEPLAPTVHSVFGRDRSLFVRWNPANSGGSPVTKYIVILEPGHVLVGTAGDVHETTVTGLENGTEYTVTVQAKNDVGVSKPQLRDHRPKATPTTPYTPKAVTDVMAVPVGTDGKTIEVSWVPPEDDGGTPITGYRVDTTDNNGVQASFSASGRDTTSYQLVNLAPAGHYAITVTPMTDARGAGDASETVTAGPALSYTDNAVVLSDATLATLVDLNANSVEFTAPPAEAPAVGKVLVIGETTHAPTGALRTVTAVSADGKTFTTANASLDDAIDDGDMTIAIPEESFDDVRVQSRLPGARVTVEDSEYQHSVNLGIELKEESKDGGVSAGITGEGVLQYTLTPHIEAKLWFSWLRPRMSFAATTRVATSVGFDLEGNLHVGAEKKPIANLRLGAITIGPIVFVPTLTVELRASFDASVAFSVEATYDQTFGGGLTYDGSWHGQKLGTDAALAVNPTMTGSIETGFGIEGSLDLLLFGVVGPGLSFEPGFTLRAEPTASPWATIDLTLAAKVKFKLDVKIVKLEYELNLWSTSYNIWHSSGEFPLVAVDPPATLVAPDSRGSVQLTASRHLSDCAGDRPPTRWELAPGGKGNVNSAGRYTPPRGGAHTVDHVVVKQSATGDCPAAEGTATVHIGSLAPEPPTGATVTRAANSDVVIAWTAPAGTVTGYVLVVSDPNEESPLPYVLGRAAGVGMTVPAAVANALGLGTESLISIAAVNPSGSSSFSVAPAVWS
ncbi:hypothetical protein JOD54_006402 [Actinokineospora baliensis]|uniref:fibronectin type III domain-containing protein n=1 Tax=Actinokineospora baliensis TaxID=547056 RepID=UPI00195A38FB|nr:fibronectin type III domain-containing protein [Actinokineospora baliensis]MBM7776198.1 hypothetical protein [Actinokineospora baliensis]